MVHEYAYQPENMVVLTVAVAFALILFAAFLGWAMRPMRRGDHR